MNAVVEIPMLFCKSCNVFEAAGPVCCPRCAGQLLPERVGLQQWLAKARSDRGKLLRRMEAIVTSAQLAPRTRQLTSDALGLLLDLRRMAEEVIDEVEQ